MLTMHEQATILTLNKQKKPKTEIARTIGCHRNTVRNVLLRDKICEKQTRDKTSEFTPYQDEIKELLEKDISKLRI